MMKDTPLRLRIEDADDLPVVSAHLQDAIAQIGDFAWDRKRRRFAGVFNRFRWETDKKHARRHSRVRAGLHFDDVSAVRSRGLDFDVKDAVAELLAIRFEPSPEAENPGGTITLDFAAGGTIALDVGCLEGHLTDLGEPWETKARPSHED